jgi:hypothetical protein
MQATAKADHSIANSFLYLTPPEKLEKCRHLLGLAVVERRQERATPTPASLGAPAAAAASASASGGEEGAPGAGGGSEVGAQRRLKLEHLLKWCSRPD